MKKFRIVIDVQGKAGLFPDIRTICGDVIYLALREGETATYRVHHVRGPRKAARRKP